MAFKDVRDALVERLDRVQIDHAGWWLLTRVHLDASAIRALAVYLNDAGFAEPKEITKADYRALNRAVGIAKTDAGQQLRRHHLLAMTTPLRLIERPKKTWSLVQLTDLGIRLAMDADTAAVFEQSLQAIVFCREPWYTASRVAQFDHFDLSPYWTTLAVMRETDGWIDRDEFDLFVCRLTDESEVSSAAGSIQAFRTLKPVPRAALIDEVRIRFDTPKSYQNWRDMALHTFSLFSLGSSAVRLDQRLVLTTLSPPRVEKNADGKQIEVGTKVVRAKPAKAAIKVAPTALVLPDMAVGADSELATPPVSPSTNSGVEGEVLVGKLFLGAGWKVVYYGQRRGFGFDIWAQKGNQVALVEVKSSVGVASTLRLTRLEYEAAHHHGKNFVLAVVEHVSSTHPKVLLIPDPAGKFEFSEDTVVNFKVGRETWSPHISETTLHHTFE